MLLRSSNNNGKSVTLKNLDKTSSKQYNQAAHNRKLSKEETYKQFDIHFTVDLSSNIKEPRIKNFIEIEKEPRIKNYTEIEREPSIKNFIQIEDPNVMHEEKRKCLFKGSWRESNREAERTVSLRKE